MATSASLRLGRHYTYAGAPSAQPLTDSVSAIFNMWQKRFPDGVKQVRRTPASSLDTRKSFPNIWRLMENIEESILKDKRPDIYLTALKGLTDLVAYCRTLETKCTEGKVSGCAGLAVLDSMAQHIEGKDSLIMLLTLHDTVLAYRKKFGTWKQAFEHTDLNKDGFIDQRELEEACNHLGMSLSPELVGEIFRACDLNNDGLIDQQEFASVLWDGGLLLEHFMEGSKHSRVDNRVAQDRL